MSPAPRPRSGHHNPRSLHAAGLLVRPACRQRALYKVKTLLASLMLIDGDTGTPRGPDVLAHSGVTRDTRATSRYPMLLFLVKAFSSVIWNLTIAGLLSDGHDRDGPLRAGGQAPIRSRGQQGKGDPDRPADRIKASP